MIKNILLGSAQAKALYVGGSLVWEREFDPIQFFENNEQGVWYDPSDLSTLFQDAAGTIPVTSSGDPVGLMLDKSGNSNHATQTISASRPTYYTDGMYHWLENDAVDDYLVIPPIDYLDTALLTVVQGLFRVNNHYWHAVKSTLDPNPISYIGLSNGVTAGTTSNVSGDARVNGVNITNDRITLANTINIPSVFSSANNTVTRFRGLSTYLMRYRATIPPKSKFYGHVEVVDINNTARKYLESYMATKVGVVL